MSAHRVSEHGSYRIQMKVKGVGRIWLATGARGKHGELFKYPIQTTT